MRHTAAAIRESIVNGFGTRVSEIQKPIKGVGSKGNKYLIQTRNERRV